MNTPGAKAYRPWTPELYAHQAHAPSAKLPEDDLVFFLIDVVPKLDLSKIHAPYQDETRGAPPFDPAMMVCLLLYSYCVGVFSSRKVARACERNLAFLAIVGEERPDFRTISLFRKNHLDAFADVFVQVLCLAKAAGLVRLGTIAIDGTKVQGNASRHKAMSYGYMTQEVARLRRGGWGRVGDSQRAPSAPASDLGASPFGRRPQAPLSCDLRLNHAAKA